MDANLAATQARAIRVAARRRGQRERERERVAHRLSDDAAPSLVEGALHDGVVGARGPRPDHERVGHIEPVHAHRQVRLPCGRGGADGGRAAPGEPALQRRGGRRRSAERQRLHGVGLGGRRVPFLDKNLWEYHGQG
jgi:hypothetical protein